MYAKLLDNDRVLLRITPNHPRFEELSSRSTGDAPPAAARYQFAEGLEVILGPEHPKHASIVRALKYAFNPNEPRDAKGKWTHGERANSLHDEFAAFKKKRKAMYKDVRADARSARNKVNIHIDAIVGADSAMIDSGLDEDGFNEAGLGDLESSSSRDQLDILKQIEKTAREALAREQAPIALTPEQKKAKQDVARMDAECKQLEAKVDELRVKMMKLQRQYPTTCPPEVHEEYQKLSNAETSAAATLRGMYERRHELADTIPEGLTEEEIADKRQHLRTILDNATAAIPHLREYIQHRKEMAAIRNREPVKLKKPKTSPTAGSDGSGQRTLFARELIKGGKGDHRPDSDFDAEQLKAGIAVEMEHTDNPEIAREIAKDHLTEDADYYRKLRKMESGAKKRYARDYTLRRAIREAAAETDLNPTELQRKVGNYRKGHVTIHGLDISIENPKGSTRSGTGKDGKPWSVKMRNHYGYIKCAISEADGDHIDVFIGPRPESEIVFVIDQVDGDWNFDEHKCMLGWTNAADAKAAYHANYSEGWHGFHGITAMTMEEFKRWIAEGDTGKEAQVPR